MVSTLLLPATRMLHGRAATPALAGAGWGAGGPPDAADPITSVLGLQPDSGDVPRRCFCKGGRRRRLPPPLPAPPLLPVLPWKQGALRLCDGLPAGRRLQPAWCRSSVPLLAPTQCTAQRSHPNATAACFDTLCSSLSLRRTTSSQSSRCQPPKTSSTSCCQRRSAARQPSCTMVGSLLLGASLWALGRRA